jgi:hypothetical protein
MTLEDVKNKFDHVSVKGGDKGKYAIIWIKPNVSVIVYENPEYEPELDLGKGSASLMGVKTIEDIKKLEELFNGRIKGSIY